MEEKNTLVAQVVCFQMPWLRDLSWGLKIKSDILLRNYFFLKKYITSGGAVSHKILYYQQLPITRYQVRFYATKYVE